ncbi:MAG: GtrA family protein [Erythrobacter sp.]|uniref:GtrA family protein n=1 Tax=Erythrobacter sp. TaxID=1042 RepID=UPI003C76BF5E
MRIATNATTQLIARMRDLRFVRYILVSVGALAVDLGAFLCLLALGAASAPAAATGYMLGIVTHWILSSRAVFHDSVASGGMGRFQQKALFVGSAIIGLGLTIAIVSLGSRAGIDPRLSKLFAVAVSFAVTYLLRSAVVFRRSPAGGRGA